MSGRPFTIAGDNGLLQQVGGQQTINVTGDAKPGLRRGRAERAVVRPVDLLAAGQRVGQHRPQRLPRAVELQPRRVAVPHHPDRHTPGSRSGWSRRTCSITRSGASRSPGSRIRTSCGSVRSTTTGYRERYSWACGSPSSLSTSTATGPGQRSAAPAFFTRRSAFSAARIGRYHVESIAAVLALFLVSLFIAPAPPQAGDPAAGSRAATQAMNEGRFEDAARIYRELLQPLPDEPGLLMNLGMALAMAGREAEAIAPLERATTLKPTLVPAQLFLGTSYLALGAPDKAMRPLQRVTAAQPANIEYRRLLARAYAESGRPLDAATQLRQVTDLAPTLPAAWYCALPRLQRRGAGCAGDLRGRRRQRPMAGAAARGRAVRRRPLHRCLRGLPASPRGGCRRWSAFTTRSPGFTNRPAMRTGRPSSGPKAASPWRSAPGARRSASFGPGATARRSRRPRSGADAESRYWRARAATELTKDAFNRLDRLPDSRERRELRAALAIADRRHADAVVELKAALKFAPKDPALIGQLGTALYLTRDYEQALAVLGPGDRLAPAIEDVAGADGLRRFAAAARSRRRGRAAPAARVHRGHVRSRRRLSLARALMRQREFGAALPLLEWQLAGDNDGSVHVQLSRALAGIGQQGQGRRDAGEVAGDSARGAGARGGGGDARSRAEIAGSESARSQLREVSRWSALAASQRP